MKIVGERLKELRMSIGYSQMQLAKMFEIGQASVFRYERAQVSVPFPVLIKYADFFDVSLDYIFGRTDKKQGRLYKGKARLEEIHPEMEQFIEMCFDPKSLMNKRLKETLKELLKGEQSDGR